MRRNFNLPRILNNMLQNTFILLAFILCLYSSVFADSSRCDHPPPRIKNGFAIVGNRTYPGRNHGDVITYVCRTNKVLVDRGKVECSSGKWVGVLPECKDIEDHSDISSTMEAPSHTSRHNETKSIESDCGFPPRIRHGYPIVHSTTHSGRNHGAVVTYVCRGNKVLVHRGKVECSFGKWVGVLPECKDIDADHIDSPSATKVPPSQTSPHYNQTKNIEGRCGHPPRVKYGFPVVSSSTHQGRNHGAVVNYICRGNKVLVKKGEIKCQFGQWVGDLPQCKRNSDSLRIKDRVL